MPLIRTSRWTVYLVIGALIVLIISQFYDPLNRVDMLDLILHRTPESNSVSVVETENGVIVLEPMRTESDIELEEALEEYPTWLLSLCCQIVLPVAASILEFYSYLYFIDPSTGNMSVVFSGILLVFGYILAGYFIERIHSKWHKDEDSWIICVDITCVEIIVMFFFDLVFSLIVKSIINSNVSDEVWIILMIVFLCLTFLPALCHLMYLVVGLFVSSFIPVLISMPFDNLNETLGSIIFFILLIFFSRYIWTQCSDKVYSFLLLLYSRMIVFSLMIFGIRVDPDSLLALLSFDE